MYTDVIMVLFHDTSHVFVRMNNKGVTSYAIDHVHLLFWYISQGPDVQS